MARKSLDSDSSSSSSRKTCCNRWLANISLEPTMLRVTMLLHMTGMMLGMVILQNFYLERICRLVLHFPNDICSNLTSLPEFEKQVESVYVRYGTYRQIIETGFPIIFSLFIGPFSDQYGTKMPMMFAMSGFFLSSVMYTFFSWFPNIPPSALLICSLPIGLSGGMISIVMSVFSFIATTSSEKNRSYRIALIEAAWFLGSPIGLIGGAAINKAYGILPVFFAATISYGMAVLSGLYFMVEDVKSKIPRNISVFFSELFNVGAVKHLFVTCFRRREGNRRRWILVLVTILNLRLFAVFGIWNIIYLFARYTLGWNTMDYSYFAAIDSVLGVTGMYSMIFIALKWLKLKDPTIGVMSCVAICLSFVVLTFASKSWMIYFSSVVGIPGCLLSTAVRSLLSKCVSKKELGKIYSFLASGEAFMPVISAAVYNSLYEHTISTFPGAVFTLSVAVTFIMFLLFLYLLFALRGFESHEEIEAKNRASRNENETDCSTASESDDDEDDGIHMDVRRSSKFDRIEIISLPI